MPRAFDRRGGGDAVDLTATRRLSLAAREGGALGLLLRHKPSCSPSAARTRWDVSARRACLTNSTASAAPPSGFLLRNRRGPCGTWTLTWDHHERVFAALSVGVAAASSDRPDRALSA